MKKFFAVLFSFIVISALFATDFQEEEGISFSGAFTIPYTWEKNSWDNKDTTVKTSGIGGEAQIRFKPYGLPLGFYGQLGISQPKEITEKRSSTTLTSKASYFDSIFSIDFQIGAYFLLYESRKWYIPFGIGLNYHFDSNEIFNITTQEDLLGIGSFFHAEYEISPMVSTFIGINASYFINGKKRRESSSGGTKTEFYNESSFLTAVSITPKIGVAIFLR